MSEPPKDPLHLVLVAPEIPWNTGNIGRTCLAAGARLHLVRPLGFRLDQRHLRRAGLDYWPHVDPVIWPHWEAFEEALPDLGEAWFFSAEGNQDLFEVSFGPPSVLIFGSESRGLPSEIRQDYASRLVSIAMETSPVRSLNLSTAAAVAIYQVKSQWQVKSQGQGGSGASGLRAG